MRSDVSLYKKPNVILNVEAKDINFLNNILAFMHG